MQSAGSCAAVIPCHNEAAAISTVVRETRRHLSLVIVVDDGSTDDTAALAASAGAKVVRLARRSGKGAALNAGLRCARELGFARAITLDGDGQHAPGEIPRFLDLAADDGALLVVGDRMGEAQRMPWLRRWVNRLMSRILSGMAGQRLPDSQCGFRLLDLEVWSALQTKSRHFEFESELLLAFARTGRLIRFVPVSVIYRAERSKIAPFRDTIRWLRWWRQARHHA